MKSWSRELLLGVALVAGLTVAGILDPRFVAPRTQALLASHSWELAIVSVAMLLVIVSGGIDLSVGSIVALSAVTTGLLVEKGFDPWWAAGIGTIAGCVAGALNGWIVARTRIHPLLVTLASMAAFRGIAEGMSMARPLSGYGPGFLSLAEGWRPALAFALVAAFAHVLLIRTRWGRWIVAMGLNETASRFSKLPVDGLKVALYAGSGLAAGVAAQFWVARNNTAKADMAIGLELDAIAAVVLGGASIDGGRGRVVGLVLGLALIHEVREFVSWRWRQSELNLIVIGAMLIGAVLLERVMRGRAARIAHNDGQDA